MQSLGVYLHIPFCVSKCAYCDFYSVSDPSRMDAYTAALIAQIVAFPSEGYTVDTVYCGGGTPSLLGGARLARILHAVRTHFSVLSTAEITVECNPESTTPELLEALRTQGVNRLSIGVQSAQDVELRRLGRVHDFRQAQQAVWQAQQMGFDNISLDLMYGLPESTGERFLQSVDAVLQLQPQHLSCYGLKLEPNTPMGRENPPLPDEDAQADAYLALCDRLRKAGWEHYEISNWAKPGYRSRHNQKYWDLSDYVGFGPGAHSLLHGCRTAVPRDLEAYLRGDAQAKQEAATPDFSPFAEFVMLRLRTADGIDFRDAGERFDVDPARYEAKMEQLAPRGLTAREDGRWRLTEAGFLVSNAVILTVLE